MNRRTFLCGLTLGTLSTPPAASAQPAGKVWRIGYLGFDSRTAAFALDPFRDGLRELGYVEGKNIVLEYRWASPDPGRYPTLAAELAAVPVDVIVAPGNQAALAAKIVTTTIPIVALGMLEPVDTGIVKSLARPGGNVTGVTWEESTAQVTKKLELFKDLVPTASRMAAVWDPTFPGLARYWSPFLAATALGMAVYSVEYARVEDLDQTLATIRKDRPNAIFFWGGPPVLTRREALCDFALQNRLPTLGPFRSFTEAGCLISYAPNVSDNYRGAATYVDKILKGAKPADLPVSQPTKYELVVNAKTAKALGLTIPPSLLLRADQVIE